MKLPPLLRRANSSFSGSRKGRNWAGNRLTGLEPGRHKRTVATNGAHALAQFSQMLPLAGLFSIQWIMDENPLTPLHPNYVKLVRLVAVLFTGLAIVVALILEARGGAPRRCKRPYH